jgi:hypothetical protein
LLLPIAPGSPFARAIGFRPVENAMKRLVNVISLSLVWLDRDVELDLRPALISAIVLAWELSKGGCQRKISPDINAPYTNGQLR